MQSANNKGNFNYDHCLRKHQTKVILENLIRTRTSINLVGDEANGSKRILEDIQNIPLKNSKCILVDLKEYRYSYRNLVNSISDGLGLEIDENKSLVEVLAAESKKSCLHFILMHNLDYLMDENKIDSNYSFEFINALNNLKNRDNFVLICTSIKSHSNLKYLGEYSYLNLEVVVLDKITRKELEQEFFRRLSKAYHLYFDSNIHYKHLVLQEIIESIESYSLLIFLCDKILFQNPENGAIKFEERLKKWVNDFKSQRKKSPSRVGFDTKNRITNTIKSYGIRVSIIGDIIKSLLKRKSN